MINYIQGEICRHVFQQKDKTVTVSHHQVTSIRLLNHLRKTSNCKTLNLRTNLLTARVKSKPLRFFFREIK